MSERERNVEQEEGAERPEDRQTEAERTAVITESAHREDVLADAEAPDGPGAPNSAPPQQRGGASVDTASEIPVGQPQHGTHGDPAGEEPERAAEPTYAFSSHRTQWNATTWHGEPVAEPERDEPQQHPWSQATVRIDQPTVRTTPPRFDDRGFDPPPIAPSTRVRPSRVPRRASLQLKQLDPWSVLKLSLVLNVAGFLAWMVAVGVLYGVLDGMGVWDQLNGTYSDLTSVSDADGGELISGGRVFGFAAVVGAVNIVLFTAMATVGAFIYNVASDLAGGVELTLSERD